MTILGEEGQLAAGADCTTDGQIGCVTTSRYKSMDTDPSVISVWDIRKGKTAGGLDGELAFYKSMVGAFNRASGTGAHGGADVFDTVNDINDNGAFPMTVPTVTNGGAAVAGWYQATGANWVRDAQSDNGAGGGTAGNGLCEGSEHCVFKDLLTGLYWTRHDGSFQTWENAITYCNGLNGTICGGYASGWRLPTSKEQFQAYIDGIYSLKDANKLNLEGNTAWSSTTYSTDTAQALCFYFGFDTSCWLGKATATGAVCVR